ncbi:uncharacterized protein DFL_000634 [Arthrobotrys flagrans]|uniref:Chitin-binding type-4 domain-containing protein n=1 Tax=Arthrobotrys flagrans TaxID=97331 RepID=A0A437AEA9_ARTFL|nr:hypothetical protein DFL_000634 [Arthrobotrys flagrans]
MHFVQFSAGTAVALLASISQVSAHVRFISARGDKNAGGTVGGALAHLHEFPVKDYGGHQHPGQWDTAVFSDPIVPACCWSPYKTLPRKYMGQGCGADLHNVFDYWTANPPQGVVTTPPTYANNAEMMWKHRNYHFFMRPTPAGGYIQIKKEIQKEVNHKRMARASQGGWIEITTWQVNADGAGPFRCKLDTSGTGQKFGAHGWLNVLQQPPGEQSKYSVFPWGSSKRHTLKVQLPAKFDCNAEYGSYDSVCILRCENFAQNGPFGGCVPFQLVYPNGKPKPPPVHVAVTKPQPKPDYGNAGYDVGKGNYKEGDYGSSSVNLKSGSYRKKMKRVARRSAEVEVAAPADEE